MISELLDIKKGITAVIGSGGKTSLILRLADELKINGKVVFCTTTRIMRPEQMPVITEEAFGGSEGEPPERLEEQLSSTGVVPVCIGTVAAEDSRKLSAPATEIFTICKATDYVLVEADGARHCHMKAHAAHEPVIPEGTRRTILLVGVEGFGKPISETVHRPELFAALAGVSMNEPVTPHILAKVLLAEKDKFGHAPITVVINRTTRDFDDERSIPESDLLYAGELKNLTGFDVCAGAVIPGILQRL